MAAVDGPPRSSLEHAIAERNAVAIGAPLDWLMDNAGRVLAEELIGRFPDPSARIVVLSGGGNNGGDGASAVDHLRQGGRTAELWVVPGRSEVRSSVARHALALVDARSKVHEGVPSVADLAGSAVVVDALLGAGQAGELRAPYREAVEHVRASKVPVLAVDLPTGFGGPEALVPNWTVTLSCPKIGLTEATGGTITVRSIGIPEAAFDHTGPGDFLAYPRPTARGRKARVAVIGGGPFTGAPALAALAALRSGAERATVYAPEPAAAAIRALSPDLVVVPSGDGRIRQEDVEGILDAVVASKVGAVVVGMGLGRHPETLEALPSLLKGLSGTLPLVVDADALDALPAAVAATVAAPVVVTPNEGEFARVFGGEAWVGPESRIAAAAAASHSRGVTVVLKGAEDVIAGNQRIVVSGPHSRSMNVGGSGDVLAGIIGRLLADRLDPVHAARLAAHWLGDTGGVVGARLGDGLLATDLIEHLPMVLQAGLRAARPE
ncbi:MAG: NAD(P)H-hydrate dehydratase [Candidatus Lutacidiplasmatales archaeon]